MPEMRSRSGCSLVDAIGLLAAGVLLVAACVPRPTSPVSPPGAVATPSARSAEPSSGGPIPPTPTPSFVRPTPLPAPTFVAYVVAGGDTLTSIARAFHTTPRSIAFWSRGQHPSLDPESTAYQPNRIEVGWILLLVPDAVFDEDELPADTPSATASATASATPGASPS
jgi:hypothetical protein